MIREILGVEAVGRLYLELLFKCNFDCSYCYHGERLKWKDKFTVDEVGKLALLFRDKYQTRFVTLLGGEPFIYKELEEALHLLNEIGLKVDIITNGYKIVGRLEKLSGLINELRISVDGLGQHHDSVRRQGSFQSILETLAFAKEMDLATSVTMTVDDSNVADVVPLANLLSGYGVKKMDVHCVRDVGFGKSSANDGGLDNLLTREKDSVRIPILFEDEVVHPACLGEKKEGVKRGFLDRINLQANGEMYLSCTFTGTALHSFWYDKAVGEIKYLGRSGRELELLGL